MRGFQPSHFFKRVFHLLVFSVCGLTLLSVVGFSQEASDAEASPLDWTLDPVYEQNAVDGVVLGLSGDVVLSGFRPFARFGYGLSSGHIRYEAGLGWQNWSLSMYDWADTTVLGRVGESGMMARYKNDASNAALRMAQLWALEQESAGPDVQYIQSAFSHTLSADFDLSITFDSHFTLGMLADGRHFQSEQNGLRGRWGDLRFSFSKGTSSNEAELPGFEYTRGMRGYDDSLKGHAFWRGRLDRRARLLTVPLEFDKWLGPDAAGIPFPDLAIGLDASAFGEVLQLRPNVTNVDAVPDADALEPDHYMGWGVGLVVVVDGLDFELRFDLFFNRSGDIKPLFG